jgi:DNA-binding NarL/FixJ family response regulator
MTRLILLLDAGSVLALEVAQPAEELLQALNRGEWTPPGSFGRLLNKTRLRCMRAVILGGWVVALVDDPAGPEALSDPPASEADRSTLSPRQHQILDLLAQGLTNKQIAQQLSLSLRTVNLHIAEIKSKMSAQTNAQSVNRAMALGYCRPFMRKKKA